ncbi:MAG: hypothetical protein ACKVPJ_05970 [Chitinophagales bacterium]
MLEQLLKLAQENLAGLSHNIPDAQKIEPDKMNGITSQTIISTIMQQMKGGNLDVVKELFSGNHTADDATIVNSLKTPVAENLMSKLGLSKNSAQQLALMAIPIVMNMLNGRVKNAQNSGLNVNDMLNQLNNKSGGGLVNSIMSMFGGGNKNMKIINQLLNGLMK